MRFQRLGCQRICVRCTIGAQAADVSAVNLAEKFRDWECRECCRRVGLTSARRPARTTRGRAAAQAAFLAWSEIRYQPLLEALAPQPFF